MLAAVSRLIRGKGHGVKKEADSRAFTLIELPVVRPFDKLRPRKCETKGFTLIELLVVIAIIALLIALFAPNLTAALRHARTVQCATNLKRIGQAFATHRGIRTGRPGMFDVGSWPRTLLPLLDDEEEILICPDAAEEDVQAGYVCLKDRGQMDFASGAVSPLDEGPLTPKLSEPQFMEEQARGFLTERVRWSPPAYDPRGNPNIYWLCYEDIPGGGDRDFEDLLVKVTHMPGTAEIRFFRGGWTVYWSKLVDYEEGRDGRFVPSGAHYSEPTEIAEPYYMFTGGGSTYGMNMNVGKLAGGTGKILAIDYDDIVVDTDAGAWDPDPSFARHGRHDRKINAVHMDGSVKLKSPDDIDPAVDSVGQKYWRP